MRVRSWPMIARTSCSRTASRREWSNSPWILDDAPLFDPRGQSYMNPRDVARVWMDEFDKAYEERGMFILTLHPHISGHRSRIIALELLIAHIKTRSTGTLSRSNVRTKGFDEGLQMASLIAS